MTKFGKFIPLCIFLLILIYLLSDYVRGNKDWNSVFGIVVFSILVIVCIVRLVKKE